MSKFNSSTKKKTTKTVNLAGGSAYKESSKLEIASILLTSFLTNQFYQNSEDTSDKLSDLICDEKDKQFIAKTALFARNEYGMRSITHLTAADIAYLVKGESWTKRFLDKVIHRADDITEILSCYINKYGKPIPNSLKKGLAKAFSKFDSYQLAKYKAERKDLSLVDVVNLVHPIPTEKNREALQKLIKGELKSTETWESKLTKAGQTAESEEEKDELKNAAWRELILEKKIGYFALLRNIRNILKDAPEVIDNVCELLVDEEAIKKSLVLPFRFTTAIEEIEKTCSGTEFNKIAKAINKALEISLQNVPKFNGRTAVVLDVSGSMGGKLSQIASLFTAVLLKTNDCDLITFANSANYKAVNTGDTITTISKSLRFTGGGTNFGSIFQTANKKYDRFIILSDMQGWVGSGNGNPSSMLKEYETKYGVNPYIYSFDLNNYGTLMFPENRVCAIAGFSEKVFDIIKFLEEDKKALINKIESIEI